MIEVWFPTLIYKDNLGPLVDNRLLYSKAIELKSKCPRKHQWDSEMYNSLDVADIRDDPVVKDLIEKCKVHVLNFVRELGVEEFTQINCKDCWFNVYEKGDYQEVHVHTDSHFSLVYYVRVPPDSGDVVFMSPTYLTDAMRLKTKMPETVTHKTQDSDVLIFKSNTSHRVTQSKNQERRVSIAMNFIVV